MTDLRPGLPPLPRRMRSLPVDERGYPVPWFVQWFLPDGSGTEPGAGKPDFRVADGYKRQAATKYGLCWICGSQLGKQFAFVIGPMCAVNRVSGDPPSHVSCAEFAAIACPFLARPNALRREANLPEAASCPGGTMIPRNPGVALVWITTGYELIDDAKGGYVFRIGGPVGLLWYAEGRQATRAEVMASIESGLPILQEIAKRDGHGAEKALAQQVTIALDLVPA